VTETHHNTSGQPEHHRAGIAGAITRAFIHSPLTPLLYVACLAMGLMGLVMTPRQEDPQISVPMVDIMVEFTGASSEQVASLALKPLERMMKEIPGVKHVYSAAQRGGGLVTVQFDVGEKMEPSLVKLYDKLASNLDKVPPGVSQPLVKPKGVDDVPVVALTLWSERVDDASLRLVALEVQQRLNEVPNTSQSFIVGGRPEQISVEIQPERLRGFGIGIEQVAGTISAANARRSVGSIETGGRSITIDTGRFLQHARDVESLIVGVHNGAPVYVRDVASVREGPGEASNVVQYMTGPATKDGPKTAGAAAVTIAVAKKVGTNGVTVADSILEKTEQLKGRVIPDNVNVAVTRNYGQTANDKVNQLIKDMMIATGMVAILIFFFLGIRPTFVVLAVIPVIILLTIFAAWILKLTVDRVSLFALIFSIGILVDDAAVVVENIYRRWLAHGSVDTETTIDAVSEVGNPTILATFTVIAALMPMGFVSGMMGPYMLPIPILGSVAMLLSLFAAFIFTPYMAVRFRPSIETLRKMQDSEHRSSERLEGFFRRMLGPMIDNPGRARLFRLGIWGALILACTMFYTQHVRVKMLPLDNKPEFNVVVNMPDGTALPTTANVIQRLSEKVLTIPEVTAVQTYAGTASPFNFNGLVRHYYLRDRPWEGDIQIQLTHPKQRARSSPKIAAEARELLTPLAKELGARIQVVEMPPGPPVLQTMVAEIYGPDAATRRQVARDMAGVFEKAESIVDVDTFLQDPYDVLNFVVDQQKARHRNVSIEDVTRQLGMVMGGHKLGDAKLGSELEPRRIVLQAGLGVRADLARLNELPITTRDGKQVPLSELGTFVVQRQDPIIYAKDLRPVEYVTGEVAGRLAAPAYGMIQVSKLLADYKAPDHAEKGEMRGPWFGWPLFGAPNDSFKSAFEWTGEWTVTYETFRDMGGAFMVALVLIYMLVVLEFGNFRLPGIIMAPIPLTLIGIIPGHWLMGAEFTATSMIGWIALAGIIVRNSILLVDFSKHAIAGGMPVREAVIQSARTRTRPIVITSLAMMTGASMLINDYIFQGMALSLMFGAMVSTALTLFVIPLACSRAHASAWSASHGLPGEAGVGATAVAADGLEPELAATAGDRPARPGLLRRAGGVLGLVAGAGASVIASGLGSLTDMIEGKFGSKVARPIRLTGRVLSEGTANLLGRSATAESAEPDAPAPANGGGSGGVRFEPRTAGGAAAGVALSLAGRIWTVLREGSANLIQRTTDLSPESTGDGQPSASAQQLEQVADPQSEAGAEEAVVATVASSAPSLVAAPRSTTKVAASQQDAAAAATPVREVVRVETAPAVASPVAQVMAVAPSASADAAPGSSIAESFAAAALEAARKAQAASPSSQERAAALQVANAAPVSRPAAAAAPRREAPSPAPASSPARATSTGNGSRPVTMSQDAAAGMLEDLKQIKGISRSIERSLQFHGVTSLAQIAAWNRADIEHFSSLLQFADRIEREDWVGQANTLMSKGTAQSPSRTNSGAVGDGSAKNKAQGS